jgi:hypothetical protein
MGNDSNRVARLPDGFFGGSGLRHSALQASVGFASADAAARRLEGHLVLAGASRRFRSERLACFAEGDLMPLRARFSAAYLRFQR